MINSKLPWIILSAIIFTLSSQIVSAAEICGNYRAPKPTLDNEPSNPSRISIPNLPKRSIFGNADGYLIPLDRTVDAFLGSLSNDEEICIGGTSVYNPMGPRYDWYVFEVKLSSKR